jgi:hypothetical protein
MSKIDEINTALYKKMSEEQENFIRELKQSTPEIIIESAYEIVIREDILLSVEENEIPVSKAKQLLKLEKPLDSIYQECLRNDYSHMDMIEDTINDFAGELEMLAKKKNITLDR